MTTLKHTFTSPVVDDLDPDIVGPDEWNDDHVSDHPFLVVGAVPGSLTGARSFVADSTFLDTTDAGAGGNLTIGVGAAKLLAWLNSRSTSDLPEGSNLYFTPARAVTAVQAAGAALTRTNDTNVTATLGGTPATALLQAVSITLGWTGLLGLARGGTHADLSGTGGAGQYLKQVTAGADITVGTIPAGDIGSGAALTRTNDTNVTVTLGGTPAAALLAAVSLTLGWTGTLAVARGGIGVGTLASNGVLYGNGTSAVLALAVNSTGTNKFLTQISSGAPAWNAIAAVDLPGSFSGLANPTASLGLAVVNGSATTAMRSDGAPALSQSIAPSWTGVHVFTNIAQFAFNSQAVPSQTSGLVLNWNFSGGAGENNFFQCYVAATTAFTWNQKTAPTTQQEIMRLGPTGILDVVVGYRINGAAASGNFLRGNGSSFVSSAITAADLPANGANPTASIGLSAVNGSATTWMRSDGAPALSQAITPTWSANHVWNAAAQAYIHQYAIGGVGKFGLAMYTGGHLGWDELSVATRLKLFIGGGSYISGPLNVDATGIQIAGAATAGNVLKSNGTYFTDGHLNFDATDLKMDSGQYTTWTPGYTGFSANPTVSSAKWIKVGSLVFITYQYSALGTSNANTFTITGLPFAPANTITRALLPSAGADGGANMTTNIWYDISGTTMTLFNAVNASNAWTASGAKGVYFFSIFYQYA